MLLAAPLMLGACGASVSSASAIDDARIATQVKTAFVNDPDVDIARIDVRTTKGVVTLSGRLKSKDEEAKAIALARAVQGVTDVRSLLQIQP